MRKNPCLGGICRNDAVKMPERHLGLVTAQDRPLSASHIEEFAQWIETNLDLDKLLPWLSEVKQNAAPTDREAKSDQRPVRTGCFPFRTRMPPKLRTLGYREVALSIDSIIGPKGMIACGHEFHYSDIESAPEGGTCSTNYKVAGRKGQGMQSEGYFNNRTQGSYIHLHFGSQPEIAKYFVEKCRMYQSKVSKTPHGQWPYA